MKIDAGLDIKVAMLRAGLKGYEVAHEMGISESKFSRLLRNPTSDQEKDIMAAVERMQEQKAVKVI